MIRGSYLKAGTAAAMLVLAACIPHREVSQEFRWVGTWSTSPYAGLMISPAPGDVTLRQRVRTSIGGKALRVRFSNDGGTAPLRIAAAQVALSAGGTAIRAGTDHALRFGGNASVTIPPSGTALSDAVDMALPAFADLAISLLLPPQSVGVATWNADPRQTGYMVAGDALRAISLVQPTELKSWYFLAGVDVLADAAARAVITLGDSITSGYASTMDGNRRWPDILARRLAANPPTSTVGVLNQGISGNRLLQAVAGPSALARLDRDVLGQSGTSHLIVLIGINDLGRWGRAHLPADEVSAEDMIAGFRQLIARARSKKIRVIGATLLPYQGANYWSRQGEEIRQAVNRWIRDGKGFDGVVDFDAAVRDPENPARYLEKYDSGDHLHPNDAGMEAMAAAIDLKLLE